MGAITVVSQPRSSLSAADGAHAQTNPDAPSGYFLTIVARHCPDYPDIRPNLARNNIQESLENLGAGRVAVHDGPADQPDDRDAESP